jgi:transcriptional regulator with PAS, ATPase and Fis domain
VPRLADGHDGIVPALQAYDWPGNVRELENTIERAVALNSGPLISAHDVTLESSARKRTTGMPSLRLRDNVEWAECETLRQALRMARAKQHAARLMGISPRALSYYLAKYRIVDAGAATPESPPVGM